MDIEYLEKLEQSLTSTFNQSHKTYSELDAKARFVATAFAGLLVGITGYVMEKSSELFNWQYVFFSALIPPFIFCFWNLYLALKSYEYEEGMNLTGEVPNYSLKEYYQQRADYLNRAMATNSLSNTKKARGITQALLYFILSFFLAGFCSTIFQFLSCLPAEPTIIQLSFFGFSVSTGVLLIFIFAHRKLTLKK